MLYPKASGVTSMLFFRPRKKTVEKEAEAEALKEQILNQMSAADKSIKEVSKTLSDPTLQIFYATRLKRKKKQ